MVFTSAILLSAAACAAQPLTGSNTFSASPKHLNKSTDMACDFGAFVNETDPSGVNVRQAPKATSKILGKIPPKYVNKEYGVTNVSFVEVRVIASRDGWFLIGGAGDNELLTGKPERSMYEGQGWVSGKKLAVKTQASKARMAPNPKADVAFLVGSVLDGDSLSKPGYLVACEGNWVQLDYSLSKIPKDEIEDIKINPAARKNVPKDHVRGWVTRICDIQETSCSGLGGIPE